MLTHFSGKNRGSLLFLSAPLAVAMASCSLQHAGPAALMAPNPPPASRLSVAEIHDSELPDSADSEDATPASVHLSVTLPLPGVTGLPGLADADAQAKIVASVQAALKSHHVSADRVATITPPLVQYLSFLGVGAAGDGEKKLAATLSSLMNSSLSFLYCRDLEDWACLESAPPVLPTSVTRQDVSSELGKPVPAGASLNLEYFISQGWNNLDPATPQKPKVVAATLAGKILSEARQGLYFAIYGIDDIQGSMKGVYDAIMNRLADGATIHGVQDIRVVEDRAKIGKLLGLAHPAAAADLANLVDFSYIKPTGGTKAWFFDPMFDVPAFQYADSATLIRALNAGIHSESEARAHIENPDAGIMHNKFMIFEDASGAESVWTGTANISRTCMGQELNANMSVYLKNDIVARKAYRVELDEMFGGAFHQNKRPNSSRYFTFDDGTELRVHFSPTDDSMHRAILPLLLSARPGDEIRISMFGASGLEAVRAFQWAAARGVKIRVVVDRLTGSQVGSWHKDKFANVLMTNPYAPGGASGSIEVHSSAWAGLDHQKIGTLNRKQPDGSFIAETILIGSQNWSAGGNDVNDENMLSLRNRAHGLPIAEAFNHHFDQELWGASKLPSASDGQGGDPDEADAD